MLPFHERLARVGLSVLADHGFVLAGGYALSAHGIGQRPSNDVDLFTDNPDQTIFHQARDLVIDAVANKMAALWSRGEVRDFIDIDTAVQSGRFTREEVLALADQIEHLPLDRHMLAGRFRESAAKTPSDYARYGLIAEGRAGLIARFTEWADQIDPAVNQPAKGTAADASPGTPPA